MIFVIFNLFKNNLLKNLLKAFVYSGCNKKISQSNYFKFLAYLYMDIFHIFKKILRQGQMPELSCPAGIHKPTIYSFIIFIKALILY
jgi:hypothetical protein